MQYLKTEMCFFYISLPIFAETHELITFKHIHDLCVSNFFNVNYFRMLLKKKRDPKTFNKINFLIDHVEVSF